MNKFQKFGLTKSKMERYLRCPFSYDCHYNKKIRPFKTGSALMFGVGLDEAFNSLLLKDGQDPMEVYNNKTLEHKVGTVDYGKYDYDKYLLSYQDKEKALAYCKELGYKGEDVDELWNELYDKEKLNPKHEKAMDYLGRLGLSKKAEIMIEAYKEQVLPRIKKVHAVQKASETGIVDLIADIDKKGNTYIIDNKTSSFEYEDNEADYSVQLTLYAIEEKINKVMFIVIPKKIDKEFTKICKDCGHKAEGSHKTCDNEVKGKRCHGEWKTTMKVNVQIQFVEAEVTETMKKRSLEIKDQVGKAIDSKNFPCNFANCGNQFGKPCEYRDLYWKGSMEGLEDQSKGKK